MSVKIGLMFTNAGPFGSAEGAAAIAEAADANNIESLWTVEHVVIPTDYQSAYPYSADGKMPGPENMPIVDPLIWLTWAAAHSERVKLATGILILPQRNPLVLAKEVASLDFMSKGRVLLGIGVGWLEEEFKALDVPFARRGARTDDYVAALRELWTQDDSTHSGEFCTFEKVKSYPKPAQGSVPIIVGGHSPAAARRAGRLGDGFFPAQPNDLDNLLDIMRTTAEKEGRDPSAIEVTTGGLPTPDFIKKLEDQGVHRIVVPPPAFTPDTIGAALERLQDSLA